MPCSQHSKAQTLSTRSSFEVLLYFICFRNCITIMSNSDSEEETEASIHLAAGRGSLNAVQRFVEVREVGVNQRNGHGYMYTPPISVVSGNFAATQCTWSQRCSHFATPRDYCKRQPRHSRLFSHYSRALVLECWGRILRGNCL